MYVLRGVVLSSLSIVSKAVVSTSAVYVALGGYRSRRSWFFVGRLGAFIGASK